MFLFFLFFLTVSKLSKRLLEWENKPEPLKSLNDLIDLVNDKEDSSRPQKKRVAEAQPIVTGNLLFNLVFNNENIISSKKEESSVRSSPVHSVASSLHGYNHRDSFEVSY